MQYHTMTELCDAIVEISHDLHQKLLNKNSVFDTLKSSVKKKEPLIGYTDAEKAALKILNTDAKLFHKLNSCDEFDNVTDRQAKMFGYQAQCNFRNLTINCCKKCEGEIKLV